MTNIQTYFKFHNYNINLEQAHETLHQLHYTFDEISHNGSPYMAGKLKFFLDSYAMVHLQLHINETVVIDNYYSAFKALYPDLTEDSASDLLNDYIEDLEHHINKFFYEVHIRRITGDDPDEIIELMNEFAQEHELNFQEQQFIIDCYYSVVE